MIDSKDGVEADRTGVNMAIRKIQFAPTKQGRQPSTTVRKVKVKQFCNDLIKLSNIFGRTLCFLKEKWS